jgi:serine protease Do
MSKTFAFRVLLLVLACVSWTGSVTAQSKRGQPKRGQPDVARQNEQKFLGAFRKAVAAPARSTVRLRCDGKDVALGAIVEADGWILTKASQLKGEVTCRLRDNRDLPARIVGVNQLFDLAMLKIEAKGLKPVSWRDSNKDAVGDWVATPGMDKDPVAVGVLSVAAREIGKLELERKSNDGGFLGVAPVDGDDGVIVKAIVPKSPAEKAGIEADDRILAIAGKAIKNSESLFKQLSKTRPGQEIVVRIKRDDEEKKITVKLARRPQSRSEFQNSLGSALSRRRFGFPVILQHDTVLKPIDCGGPLADLDGKVIGINIARAGRTETYAIPAETVKTLLADLKSGKHAPAK